MQSHPELSWLMGMVCSQDNDFLGLSSLEFAGLLVMFNGVFFVPVWLAWRVAHRVFNGSGFSNGVWRGWIYIVVGFNALQSAVWLSHPIIKTTICPYDQLFPYFAAVTAIFCLWVYHLCKGNAGRLSKFLTLIAIPLIIEITGLKPGITALRGSRDHFNYALKDVAGSAVEKVAAYALERIALLFPLRNNVRTGTAPTNNAETGAAATNNAGTGTAPTNDAGTGVAATNNAVMGTAPTNNAGTGVAATNNAGTGTAPTNNAGTGVAATNNAGTGTAPTSNAETGVAATSNAGTGTAPTSNAETGVVATNSTETKQLVLASAFLYCGKDQPVSWEFGNAEQIDPSPSQVGLCRETSFDCKNSIIDIVALGTASSKGIDASEGNRALQRGINLASAVTKHLQSKCGGKLSVSSYVLNLGRHSGKEEQDAPAQRKVVALIGLGQNSDGAIAAALEIFVKDHSEFANDSYAACDLYKLIGESQQSLVYIDKRICSHQPKEAASGPRPNGDFRLQRSIGSVRPQSIW
jgi:hypothetical protein